MHQAVFAEFTRVAIDASNLLEAPDDSHKLQHVRLLSSEPRLVCASKVYSGLGADIVYGIIALKTSMSAIACQGQAGRNAAPTNWSLILDLASTLFQRLVGMAVPH